MGKRILIKNASFEDNGFSDKLSWYFKLKTGVMIANKSAGSNKYHIQPSELTRLNLMGKTVNCVKMYAATAGTMTFGSWNPTLPYADAEIESHTYNVVSGMNVIKLQSPIVLSATCVPFIYGSSFVYWSDKADTTYGWNFGSNVDSAVTGRIPIDWGFTIE